LLFLLCASLSAVEKKQDTRELVSMPEEIQQELLADMRDHLNILNQILIHLANDEMDEAAELAEYKLGMSSMGHGHGGERRKYMPDGMRNFGQNLHRSASRFARKAEEGELDQAIKSLSEMTSICTGCHASYRIR
jgi:soluble cytochrome b562